MAPHAGSVEIGENMGLANFPSDVRDSYRMLLPKFNALRVVIDEQKRNTRDILGICHKFSKD